MLGFDSLYSNSYDDPTLARLAEEEKRIVLSRDRELLKRKAVSRGYCVRSKEPEVQIREVIKRFHLEKLLKPFSRCIRCNTQLSAIERSKVKNRVPAFVYGQYDRFKYCSSCGKIFWQGTHWTDMRAVVRMAEEQASIDDP
jgi:uncharacterized protein with PIN domain